MLATAGTQQLPGVYLALSGLQGEPEPLQRGISGHLLQRSAGRPLLRRGQRAAQRAASNRLSMARRGLLAASPPRHIWLGQVIVSEGTHLQQGGGCKAGGTGWGYGRESKAAAAAGPRRKRGSGCALALKLPVGTQGSRRPQQPWWGPCKKSHRVWDGQSHAHKVQLVFGPHNVGHRPLRVQREGGKTCVLSDAAATEAGWPWDGTTTWQPNTMPCQWFCSSTSESTWRRLALSAACWCAQGSSSSKQAAVAALACEADTNTDSSPKHLQRLLAGVRVVQGNHHLAPLLHLFGGCSASVHRKWPLPGTLVCHHLAPPCMLSVVITAGQLVAAREAIHVPTQG